jgi:hypothetical protein
MESIYQTNNQFRAIKGHKSILNALENGNEDKGTTNKTLPRTVKEGHISLYFQKKPVRVHIF